MKNPFIEMALVKAAVRNFTSLAQRLADNRERAIRREDKRLKRAAGWSHIRRGDGNGDREVARRRAQIAKGMLTESNGLQRSAGES